jgi:hypothetical protein
MMNGMKCEASVPTHTLKIKQGRCSAPVELICVSNRSAYFLLTMYFTRSTQRLL